jgi:hypothetical protein
LDEGGGLKAFSHSTWMTAVRVMASTARALSPSTVDAVLAFISLSVLNF